MIIVFLRASFDYAQDMLNGESISAFISVNQRFMKMIIQRMPYGMDYPQLAIRKTHDAVRTKDAVSRRFS
jgi:hypothetical protein